MHAYYSHPCLIYIEEEIYKIKSKEEIR